MARIVIVEDERVIAWNIRDILSAFGHEIVGMATAAEESIQLVTDVTPDLVLMDIRLKGHVDGITAADHIQTYLKIPVVYLTAHADEHTLRQALVTAPFGYVLKPFGRINLQIAVEAALCRHQAERNVQTAQQWLSTILHSMGDGMIATDRQGRVMLMNPLAENLTGWQQAEALGQEIADIYPLVHCETQQPLENPLLGAMQAEQPRPLPEDSLLKTRNDLEWLVGGSANPIFDQGQVVGGVLVFQDIGDRKRLESTLRQQAERERIINAIANSIRQSLEPEVILNTAVAEVRQFLQTDRVLIYQVFEDGTGRVTCEALAEGIESILDKSLPAEIFPKDCYNLYYEGRTRIVTDLDTDSMADCLAETLQQLKVRSKLVIPIPGQERLWGLLIAHQCRSSRQWEAWEVDLLQQLSTQLAIAIQQSHLYQQVQQVNANLEQEVRDHTAELRKSLTFEGLLKRITDKVRDSLDERQILQTVSEELVQGLDLLGSDTALYDFERETVTIACECTPNMPSFVGQVLPMVAYDELVPQLARGECMQFCEITPRTPLPDWLPITTLACPLFDDQGLLGDLWLFRPQEAIFTDQEIRLAQQVANQCAIALRQSRLYQAAQQQVTELERLNRLKDDFLSTISHELRTPMSNIRMATQMLELILNRGGILGQHDQLDRYFNILQEECQREISLINDLLDLARLDADSEPVSLSSIDPKIWIPHVVEPFLQRARRQQQLLHVKLSDDLPPITTDLNRLERILTELLDNACKYTPPGERILVSATVLDTNDTNSLVTSAQQPSQGSPVLLSSSPVPRQKQYSSVNLTSLKAPALQLCVSNSGIEIPEEECDRIFDKFYRVPQGDPWKHDGTGLGLALVKKLVEHLGGAIAVESGSNQTRFVIQLPVRYRSRYSHSQGD